MKRLTHFFLSLKFVLWGVGVRGYDQHTSTEFYKYKY
jgi:hypothetical protein